MIFGDALNLLKIIQLICGEVEKTTVVERAMNRIEKLCFDNPASVMTSLRPRVGEQEVKIRDRSFGQQVAHSIGTFHIEHANVLERGGFAAHLSDATGQSLNP